MLSPRDSARVFGTYRLLARGLQLASLRRRGAEGWRSAALAGAGLADLAIWYSIRRGRVPIGRRIAIDLADLGFWAGPGRADLVTALTPQVPLDVETGIVAGARAIGLPIVSAAVATVSRVTFGRRPEPLQNVPHVGAVIGGIVVGRGEHRRMARARQAHAAELSAKRVRAFLAGQQDVAMGASSVIDQLKPVALLLGSDVPGSALNQVRSGWKESLAEQCRQHAVYLDSALRVWRSLHNDHPDLRSYVDVVELPEGAGTTLLTGYQAGALGALLDQMDLAGRVEIELTPATPGAATAPGRSFELVVDSCRITVPADPDAWIDGFNPAPPAFFFGAWASLMPARSGEGDLPIFLASSCASAYFASALAYLGRPADRAARAAVWTGVALAGLQGLACGLGCREQQNRLGHQLFSATFGLTPAGLLLAANRARLNRADKAMAVAALTGIGALSYFLGEAPRSRVDFSIALAHPLAATISMDVFARAAQRETERLASELRREDEDAELEAFRAGRAQVLGLAGAALAEADSASAARRGLDDDVDDAVSARLKDIRCAAARLGLTAEAVHASAS